ncbi:hypothetical protein CANCADRAFT_44095 [Tortispora caseinolytica NRRL Y-17796]|uniref:FAD/NAD(P)-binding domain-containing protein n=1 Tax=Tortispora caseinolytica NRRL Y-17796 TaxID=767744 RepID=A0A1E4TFB0_9ASCO|nr:hypothetical protein CANCADRAFT_44095 [Tortispora caseinolytica NRRL Y-17796]
MVAKSFEHDPQWVAIDESKMMCHPRKLRMICIGAGYSGLILEQRITHKYKLDYIDYKIYEKNADVGGTWYENRYPGVACDIPAHSYSFDFAPNPYWSKYYATGPEIYEYIKVVTKQYNLDRAVSFLSRVVSTTWDEKSSQWQLEIEVTQRDGSVKTIKDVCDILVDGSGVLNKWKWPDIKGLKAFKGELLHSARYNEDIDLTDKRCLVIGNGSSAIQIVPAIQPKVAKLYTTFRNRTWLTPAIAPPGGDLSRGNFEFTLEEMQEFADNPDKLRAYRAEIEHQMGAVIKDIMRAGSAASDMYRDICIKLAEKAMSKKPELLNKLLPTWAPGCRRLTPGFGYLEALQEDNVEIQFQGVKEIGSDWAKFDDGTVIDNLDVIICATGFDVSFSPQWTCTGRGGQTLNKLWADIPMAYMGVMAPHMPNYFVMNGPNSPVAHGSVLTTANFAIDWMFKVIDKLAKEEIKSVCPNEQAVHEYNVYIHELLKGSVWAGDCTAWYKYHGYVTALYPGSTYHYMKLLENPRWEDFDYRYTSINRYSYLGNGTTRLQNGS